MVCPVLPPNLSSVNQCCPHCLDSFPSPVPRGSFHAVYYAACSTTACLIITTLAFCISETPFTSTQQQMSEPGVLARSSPGVYKKPSTNQPKKIPFCLVVYSTPQATACWLFPTGLDICFHYSTKYINPVLNDVFSILAITPEATDLFSDQD